MTDRINGLFVSFEKDMRDDDVISIINAIKQLRGVLTVETNPSEPLDEAVAVTRFKDEIWKKLYDVIWGR